ncbi:hypothetical protein [Roseimaritima ulvae]|uniref:Uncharacterized protein n=1 Tax=Roseimaritima ulvae TaxID=980254 RepID=A0A5B9QRB2_9BACT|nr:hypothetical protein [Roseimaritima ulvae]QEG41534.1 hypothetical protein UC8_35580 [Roseimaritima ulvae]
MPEPLLYLKATAAAAVVSVLVMLAAAPLCHRNRWFSQLIVVALATGLAAGYVVLSLPVGWPPANALARWLTIVLPLVLLIELFDRSGSGESRQNWIPWTLRVVVALALPRILLHGSVYLSGPENGWTVSQTAAVMLSCGTSLLVVWGLLVRLAKRVAPTSVVVMLVLTILATGITIMLAGYLGGGAAALPLAACLIACSLTQRMLLRRNVTGPAETDSVVDNPPMIDHLPATDRPTTVNVWFTAGGRAMVTLAVVGLFGLLFVGHFFGRLSVHNAVVLGVTPLLGWVTELPGLRNRSPWTKAVLRIVLVTVPLAVLLGLAKQKFDRELAPLM